MKKETLQKLNDVLDIAEDVVEKSPDVKVEVKDMTVVNEKSDYDFSRGQYHNLIDKGNEALDDLLSIAREGEQPRAFEVATQLINSLTAATKELLILQKTKKEIDGKDKPSKTENNLFIGSTKELQELLEQKKK